MLKKIQSKPHHIKQSIALTLTIIIFCGILFVWVSSWDARAREQEVRDKMVSPITGITSMFDGLIADFNKKISGAPLVKKDDATVPTAPKDNFDYSGVVVIDTSTTTAK